MKKKILMVTVLTMLGMAIGWEASFWKRIYPGVKVAGVNLGGMDRVSANATVASKLGTYKDVTLEWGTNKWVLPAAETKLKYDINKTIEATLSIGRSGNLIKDAKNKWKSVNKGLDVDPVFTVDENKLNEKISEITAQIDVPAQEPAIVLDKLTGQTQVSAGENGWAVDKLLLNQRIRRSIQLINDKQVEIPVMQQRPKLSEEQMVSAKNRSQALVGKSLEIKLLDEAEKWMVNDEQLMAWMDLQKAGWDRQKITEWLQQLAKDADRQAQNASFRFVSAGKVQEFKPAKDGIRVKVEESVNKVIEALDANKTQIELAADKIMPTVKTDEVNTLGVKELIGGGVSWFSGSIDNRIFNIKKAADALNGVLIPPGETFSFNKQVGEISAATGYKQAYVIKGGKTVLGDGGGVCQTSSTLFRAALAAGLPIEERVAHAYRVYYYEEKSEPGFDATIFDISPDFKFKNDTPGYILIQTTFDETSKFLKFDLYGTSDGRQTTISKARIWEVTPPPPDSYQDDPTLAVGRVVQIDHAAWGAKVAFDWKVIRGNEVLQERTFYSNYQPWQAVYLRGTKTQ